MQISVEQSVNLLQGDLGVPNNEPINSLGNPVFAIVESPWSVKPHGKYKKDKMREFLSEEIKECFTALGHDVLAMKLVKATD